MAETVGFVKRDNAWLAARLAEIRQRHFRDIPVKNTVQVRFGGVTRTRLGSITTRRLKGKDPISLITLNGLFRDPSVPTDVIDAVLSHEFVHYAHGWHSPLPRLYKHPHQGGVVDKELTARGLATALVNQEAWVKKHFARHYRAAKALAR